MTAFTEDARVSGITTPSADPGHAAAATPSAAADPGGRHPAPARGTASLSPPPVGEREALTSPPEPTGAGSGGGGNAPGEARMRTPASPGAATPPGGAQRASAALPGGSTGSQWVIELPAGLQLVTLNDRDHHMARHQKMQALKNAAVVVTRQARLPKLQRIEFGIIYDPPDNRDERDADNLAPTLKGLLDGVALVILPTKVVAGSAGPRVVGLDGRRHVKRVFAEISDTPVRKGRLRMVITDLAGDL